MIQTNRRQRKKNKTPYFPNISTGLFRFPQGTQMDRYLLSKAQDYKNCKQNSRAFNHTIKKTNHTSTRDIIFCTS